MFCGFACYLEEVDGRAVLYAEQSNRMEREIARKKFWKLARKAHEERLRRIKTKELSDDFAVMLGDESRDE